MTITLQTFIDFAMRHGEYDGIFLTKYPDIITELEKELATGSSYVLEHNNYGEVRLWTAAGYNDHVTYKSPISISTVTTPKKRLSPTAAALLKALMK